MENIPSDIPKARSEEILRWLERRMTPAEAIAEIKRDDDYHDEIAFPDPLILRILWFAMGGWLIDAYWRIVDGPRRPCHEMLGEWVSQFDFSKAELWKYDTGSDSWENLHGECGFAVVEKDVLVDSWMWYEN